MIIHEYRLVYIRTRIENGLNSDCQSTSNSSVRIVEDDDEGSVTTAATADELVVVVEPSKMCANSNNRSSCNISLSKSFFPQWLYDLLCSIQKHASRYFSFYLLFFFS